MNCEEIKQKVDIRTVLESFNLFPVKNNTKTAFYYALDREEKTPSLSVDFIKNQAFDFGTGRNYDIISIVQQINKCSVSEALNYLEKFALSRLNKIHNLQSDKKKEYEVLKVTEIKHFALIQYLVSRKVSEQKKWLREVHYELHGKKYFGIGFKNNSDGFEIRNAYVKICLGSKDITFVQIGTKPTAEVAVFEGFFDYLTFRNLENQLDLSCDCIILNSTAMLFKAKKILKSYKKILLFLDNDNNGKSVVSKIKNEYSNVGDFSVLYQDFKDLNEWFIKTFNFNTYRGFYLP